MHLKRQKVPKKWPINRKGTKYVIRPNQNLKDGIPILVFLRDMIKIAQNRKEVKKAIHEKNILINGRPVRNEKNSVVLFDKITIVPAKKNYKLNLSEFGKFYSEEIKEEKSYYKIAKIKNKKVLKGKKIQINLSDGRNYFCEIDCKINDSVIIDFKNKKVTKCLPLKENEKVIIFAGKHSGKRGKIIKIKNERKMAEIETKEKKINVLLNQIMVVE